MSLSEFDAETKREVMREEFGCEDCGDEVAGRRLRCKHCGLLLCRWCAWHTHGIPVCPPSGTVSTNCEIRVARERMNKRYADIEEGA
jgi:hypothetical protein